MKSKQACQPISSCTGYYRIAMSFKWAHCTISVFLHVDKSLKQNAQVFFGNRRWDHPFEQAYKEHEDIFLESVSTQRHTQGHTQTQTAYLGHSSTRLSYKSWMAPTHPWKQSRTTMSVVSNALGRKEKEGKEEWADTSYVCIGSCWRTQHMRNSLLLLNSPSNGLDWAQTS